MCISHKQNTINAYLPPMGLILIQDTQDVTFLEFQPHIRCRNELIIFRIIVEVSLHIDLHTATCVTMMSIWDSPPQSVVRVPAMRGAL